MRVGEALAWARAALAASSETPYLDAQTLLAEISGRRRAWLLAHPEAALLASEADRFRRAVRRCAQGEALPYVLGWWFFYGRRFRVGPEVLIPRPETELLVEQALSFLRSHPERRRALDVGTGSGCIAISLALEVPYLRLMASDLSAAALRMARRNALDHGVQGQVQLVQADLLRPLTGGCDLLCANLPYVPRGDLAALEVARREPKLALDGGRAGMEVILELLSGLERVLAPGGLALLEIGEGQADAAQEAARGALPGAQIEVRIDLAGRPRLLRIQREVS